METPICVNVKPALIMLLGGICQFYFSLKMNFNRLSKRCLSGRRTQRHLGLKEPVCVKDNIWHPIASQQVSFE